VSASVEVDQPGVLTLSVTHNDQRYGASLSLPAQLATKVALIISGDRLLLRAHPGDMNRLLSLKRSIVHIRRAVTPQREVLNQLTRHDFPFVRPENLVYFRDVYDHLIRIAEELDSLRDILSSVLEIHLASTSNQLNATMKRLTAYGTIFIAITAIAGIYGMNFKFMPELEWRYGYFVVLGVMAAISLGLYFYFKKRGDL
jgi:magnesium transporter